jgi:hypothetical protein
MNIGPGNMGRFQLLNLFDRIDPPEAGKQDFLEFILNRKVAKGAKGFIYFLIRTNDQEKNHALRAENQCKFL